MASLKMAREFSRDDLCELYIMMLHADSAPMRRVAVWELGRLGDPRAAQSLMNAVTNDPDWECRHYAIMALANVGGVEEARFLRELLAGDYLSQDGLSSAGPLSEGLAEHLASDIEFSARCCAGEVPRPGGMSDSSDQWRAGREPQDGQSGAI